MKTKKEIDEMYSFIGFFNDGKFMNQDYRNGILVALSFVKETDNPLTIIKNMFLNNNPDSSDTKEEEIE